jgi:hypothetical protein
VVDGQIRGQGSVDAQATVEAKASGLKPTEVSTVEGRAREVDSTADRVRNPDVKAEVTARAGVDDELGRATSAQATGGEVSAAVGDPTGTAKARVSTAGEGELRSRAPVDANAVTGEVDSAASTARDPKAAAESKIRSDVEGEVRVDVDAKIDPPKK